MCPSITTQLRTVQTAHTSVQPQLEREERLVFLFLPTPQCAGVCGGPLEGTSDEPFYLTDADLGKHEQASCAKKILCCACGEAEPETRHQKLFIFGGEGPSNPVQPPPPCPPASTAISHHYFAPGHSQTSVEDTAKLLLLRIS